MFGGKGSGEETADSNESTDETTNGDSKNESCQFLVNKKFEKIT